MFEKPHYLQEGDVAAVYPDYMWHTYTEYKKALGVQTGHKTQESTKVENNLLLYIAKAPPPK